MNEMKFTFREDGTELPIGMSNLQKDTYITRAIAAAERANKAADDVEEFLEEAKKKA